MNLEWTDGHVEGTKEANFTAELKSVSEQVFSNKNETEFRVCNIKLDTGKVVSGIIYDKNFQQGVNVGDSLLCRAVYNPAESKDRQIFITVSHLTAASRATIEDFGIVASNVKVEEKVHEFKN